MQDELFQTEPNMTAEAYRNNCSVEIPRRVEKHLDFLDFSDDGSMLLLGTSNLTGRIWSGSVWLFTDPHGAPEMEKCLTGMELESGVVDGKFIENNSKLVIGSDSGAIQILGLTELTDKKSCYLSTLGISCEHDDSISSLDVFGSSKIVSGSTDFSIKIWQIESIFCEKTYSPAHGHIVTSVVTLPNSSDIFASTSLDGNSLLWDNRIEKPASLLARNECGYTTTAWINENIISLGAASGSLSILDIRKKSELDRNFYYKRPIHKVKFNKKLGMLAVCSDDTVVSVFSFKGDTLLSKYKSDKHEDFVRGLSWQQSTDNLFSCGWDTKVLCHEVTKESSEKVSNSMELNCHIGD